MNGSQYSDSTRPSEQRLFNLDFTSSTLANFANSIGISMLMATLPLYVISLGGNKTEAGIVAGTAQLTALLFRPFVGWLTDAWSRRPVVLIGTSCYAAGSLIYLIAGSILTLVFGRMVHGFGASCYTTAANVYVADIAPPNRRAEAMGLFSAAQAIGIMIGPVIGFFIIEVAGYHSMFYFTGAVAATAFLISLLAREKRQINTVKRYSWSPRTDIVATDALPIAWMALCMGMGFGAVNAFISIFALPRGVANPGFYFTFQAVALLLSRTFTGRLADRYGRPATIIPGIILISVALVILPLAYGYWSFLISALLYGFGFGAAQPATMAMLMDRVRIEQRGLATSTYYIGFDFGLTLGSILMGIVSERWGFGVMWTATAAISLLSLAGLVKNRRRVSHFI